MEQTIPIVGRTESFRDRTAILAGDGDLRYGQLLEFSGRLAGTLLNGRSDLDEARVAFLAPPGAAYVVAQWAIWRAGGVAVPLCPQHPAPELAYAIDDSRASIVLAHEDLATMLRPLAQERNLPLITTGQWRWVQGAAALPRVARERRAMILYTSGTTSKPKGVVSTHDAIAAQTASLVEAWEWTPRDHILHVLPLHHIHGIVNVLCCALWSGGLCEMMGKFDAAGVWQRVMCSEGLTLFMAVPTIYSRLIAAWDTADVPTRAKMTEGCRRLRLMVSGSAALPVATLERWRQISGHTLLERYGMTEIGMGLSNPLHGERRAGCVGSPLPSVQAPLVDDAGLMVPDNTPGQIHIRGPTLFQEYWQRPEATAQAFTSDGWFKTGDIAVRENGVYRILGRESVDIIKTGGYKVSALEIEEVLRTHEAVSDCAVVGVEDVQWGQRARRRHYSQAWVFARFRRCATWCKARLAIYKVPSLLLYPGDLPRNPMGKVMKPAVIKLFGSGGTAERG